MMTMMVIRLRLGVRNRSRNEVFDLEIKIKIARAPSWLSDIKNSRDICYSTSYKHSFLVVVTHMYTAKQANLAYKVYVATSQGAVVAN